MWDLLVFFVGGFDKCCFKLKSRVLLEWYASIGKSVQHAEDRRFFPGFYIFFYFHYPADLFSIF